MAVRPSRSERDRGRTAVVIAHRLTQAARADRAVVMERSRVVEVGTHAVLVGLDGARRAACRAPPRS
jgi:ATP-binding cassette subfamily C protein